MKFDGIEAQLSFASWLSDAWLDICCTDFRKLFDFERSFNVSNFSWRPRDVFDVQETKNLFAFAPNIMSSTSREHIDTYAKSDNLKKLDITVAQQEPTI